MLLLRLDRSPVSQLTLLADRGITPSSERPLSVRTTALAARVESPPADGGFFAESPTAMTTARRGREDGGGGGKAEGGGGDWSA